MERYAGVRFETVFLDRRPPVHAHASALLAWCRTFLDCGYSSTDTSAVGNLSCRADPGFLVTPTHFPFARLEADDLVQVVFGDVDQAFVLVRGEREPSSEALMHQAIYDARPDVHAIFHGHHAGLLEHGPALGLPVTLTEETAGTAALARRAAGLAGSADVFLLRNHGFVSVGRTLDAAGEGAVALLPRLPALEEAAQDDDTPRLPGRVSPDSASPDSASPDGDEAEEP